MLKRQFRLIVACAAMLTGLVSGNAMAASPSATATLVTDTLTELKIVWSGDLSAFQSALLVAPVYWDILGVYSDVTTKTIFGNSTTLWSEGVQAQHVVAPHGGETLLGPVYSVVLGGSLGVTGFDSQMAPHNGGTWQSPANISNPHWDHFTYSVATNADGTGTATLYAIHPVPEPETYAMLLAGLGLMGVMVKRRTRV